MRSGENNLAIDLVLLIRWRGRQKDRQWRQLVAVQSPISGSPMSDEASE